MDRNEHGTLESALRGIAHIERTYPPPTLQEAKLRFQLAAGQTNVQWFSFIKNKPYISVGAALVSGLVLGKSTRLRGACGTGMRKSLGLLFSRKKK